MRTHSILTAGSLFLSVLTQGCSSNSGDSGAQGLGGLMATGGVTNSGGATTMSSGGNPASSGGSVGKGGAVANGGAVATGGAVAKGGAVASGGAGTSGGAVATGGAVAKGGAVASGGAGTSGGAVASGGTVAKGGAVASGGAVATGGAIGGGTSAAGGSLVGGGSATGGAVTSGGASGSGNVGGSSNSGGSPTGGAAAGGSDASTCGVGPTTGAPGYGTPAQTGTGNSTVKYGTGDVTRDGVTYRFITNWWGQGWTSSNVSWSGTSFTVQAAAGTSTPDGTPIGYPTTYCGRYSENAAHGDCGLPAAYSTIDKLWTGWKWHSADAGQYNAAWDIWLGTATAFQSYLMVWLRDPTGRQPAGNNVINNVTVAGVPGTWIIRYGTVNNRPIVNYVRPEGSDACEFEFNVMDFIADAQARAASTSGLTLPGDTVRAVAVGFEFWTGPFTNVVSDDFYVKLTTK